MTTNDLLNGLHKNPELLKAATVAQLQEVRDRFNPYWKRRIDEEIASRPAPTAVSGDRYSAEWKSRPGTVARFIEEDEMIHGIN